MDVFELAVERLKAKGEEHNTETITFDDYCPFGNSSAATFVYREALRICALVMNGADGAEVVEHLIDVVVFSQLMYGYMTGNEFTSQPTLGISGTQLVDWLTELGVAHRSDEHGFSHLTTFHITNNEINEARKGNLIVDKGSD